MVPKQEEIKKKRYTKKEKEKRKALRALNPRPRSLSECNLLLNHPFLTWHVLRLIILDIHIVRNVVFYCSLVKANNAIFCCQLLLLFRGRFERSGVQASCRTPNSMYQTRWPSHRCSGAGGVLNSWWRCVSVVTQRKEWTPLPKNLPKYRF